jgi:hypothetical protein
MKKISVFVSLSAALAMLLLTPEVASAASRPASDLTLPTRSASVSPHADWVCTVYASDPWNSGDEVEGDGWQTCSGAGYAPARVAIKIQRSRWYGWETMYTYISDWTSANHDEATVWYDCSGEGIHDYRIVTTGYAQGGSYYQDVQSENYLHMNCG